MKKTYTIFVLLGVVAIFLLILSGGGAHSYSDESPSFNRDYWTQELDRHGPEVTYKLFKEKNEQAPFERQHLATHVIGELFFESAGVQGIEFCDASFGFGCYHGFFGLAVASQGTAIIPELDNACVNIYGPLGTGCQHGIGHGVMEYVGYENINDALRLCEKTTQLTTLLGCTSGVFMEYNTPLTGVGDTETPSTRPFNLERPYEPCTTIDESFKESCFFELGQWFVITFNEDYEEQRVLCNAVPNDTNRSRCFMGLGTLFAPVLQYDTEQVIRACSIMKEGEFACRAGASWGFWSDPTVRSQAPLLCSFEDAGQETRCLTQADLTEGLQQELSQ